MTQPSAESRRDGVTSLFDAARVNGVAYLFAIVALRSATIPELAVITNTERHTVTRWVIHLESREFVIRAQNGRADRFFPTPQALALLGLSDMVEILPSTSSSSDQLLSERAIETQADPEEEERQREKNYLVAYYGITGKMAQALVEDSWISSEHIVAWMSHVHGLQRDGRKFRKSPEAYAITCLLNHHEPPQRAMHAANESIVTTLQMAGYTFPDDEADEEAERAD